VQASTGHFSTMVRKKTVPGLTASLPFRITHQGRAVPL
jgi:hypothetical protein